MKNSCSKKIGYGKNKKWKFLFYSTVALASIGVSAGVIPTFNEHGTVVQAATIPDRTIWDTAPGKTFDVTVPVSSVDTNVPLVSISLHNNYVDHESTPAMYTPSVQTKVLYYARLYADNTHDVWSDGMEGQSKIFKYTSDRNDNFPDETNKYGILKLWLKSDQKQVFLNALKSKGKFDQNIQVFLNDGGDLKLSLNVHFVSDTSDSDGDGVGAFEENNVYYTNPNAFDSDGDGLFDGYEVHASKTDPTKSDTDGDGLNDGDEVNTSKTDPTKSDTDADGLDDGVEVNTSKTDPNKTDTDGDGLSDSYEVNTSKTDPNKGNVIVPKLASITKETKEIKGTTNPGATVTVINSYNVEISKATADGDGKFTLALPKGIEEGKNISVVVTIADGTSKATTVSVEEGAPTKPTVDQIHENDTIVKGLGKAGNTISVQLKGKEVGKGAVGNDGTFSITIPKAVKDAVYQVIAKNNAGVSSKPTELTVDPVKAPAPTMTLAEYKIGAKSISGTYTGDDTPAAISLFVNGTKKVTSKGSVKDGKFSFYCAGLIKAGDTVKMVAYDKANKEIVSQDLSIASPAVSAGTIKTASYQLGDKTFTGTYEGNLSSAVLVVNDKVVSAGGNFKDGKFSFYCAKLIKVGDKVEVGMYDQNKQVINKHAVEVSGRATGAISKATYQLGSKSMTGEFTGTVTSAQLLVNGKVVTKGGTFKDGKFSYYMNASLVKAGDKVSLQGYDSAGAVGKIIEVTVSGAATGTSTTPSKESIVLTSATYKVGSKTIEGIYDGSAAKLQLVVNGSVKSAGGSLKDGKLSYYVGGVKYTKDDDVKLIALDSNGKAIDGASIQVQITPAK
jgi:hypothetical protein